MELKKSSFNGGKSSAYNNRNASVKFDQFTSSLSPSPSSIMREADKYSASINQNLGNMNDIFSNEEDPFYLYNPFCNNDELQSSNFNINDQVDCSDEISGNDVNNKQTCHINASDMVRNVQNQLLKNSDKLNKHYRLNKEFSSQAKLLEKKNSKSTISPKAIYPQNNAVGMNSSQLYNPSIRSTEKMKRLIEEKRDKEMRELENCTFKPRTNSTHVASTRERNTEYDVYQRQQAWMLDKENKLEQEKLRINKKNQEIFTFNPNINPKSRELANQQASIKENIMHYDNHNQKYFERMLVAKEIKKQQEEKVNQDYSKKWDIRKKGMTTINRSQSLIQSNKDSNLQQIPEEVQQTIKEIKDLTRNTINDVKPFQNELTFSENEIDQHLKLKKGQNIRIPGSISSSLLRNDAKSLFDYNQIYDLQCPKSGYEKEVMISNSNLVPGVPDNDQTSDNSYHKVYLKSTLKQKLQCQETKENRKVNDDDFWN